MKKYLLSIFIFLFFLSNFVLAGAIRYDNQGQWINCLRTDDGGINPSRGSNNPFSLGFSINFFGTNYSNIYVNNNGHITFDAPMYDFSPFGIVTSGKKILAAFFTDIDTNSSSVSPVSYGNNIDIDLNDGTGSHKAFFANWINVGEYYQGSIPNSFQIVLINRDDTGTGNFDIEFNYDSILWDHSSAAIGWSSGSTTPGAGNWEDPYSRNTGVYLNTGTHPLKDTMVNSNIPGRFYFQVRNGQMINSPGIPPNISISNLTNNQVISGNYAINGTITDNVSLNYYTVSISTDNATWTNLVTVNNTEVISGNIYNFDTHAFDDGDYYIQIRVKDISNNEFNIINNVKIRNLLVYRYNLENGKYYFISSPFKTNPLIGYDLRDRIAIYDSNKNDYIINPNSTFISGYAYWIQPSSDISLSLIDNKLIKEDITITVNAGWNMIGNPFSNILDINNIIFQPTTSTVTYNYNDSISNNYISGESWIYNNSTELYELSKHIPTWEGTWLNFNTNGKIIIPIQTSKIQAKNIQSKQRKTIQSYYKSQTIDNNIYIYLSIKNKNNQILDNYVLGLNKNSNDNIDNSDLKKPPISPKKIASIYSISNNDMYCSDIKNMTGDSKKWNIFIDARNYNEDTLKISLENLQTQNNKNLTIKLNDESNNKQVNIKKQKEYTIDTKIKKTYSISLEIENYNAEAIDQLATDFLIYPNPFNPYSLNPNKKYSKITYTLNAPAKGDCYIYSLSGRLIKKIEINDTTAGNKSIEWDGKNNFGQIIPSDVYFCVFYLKNDMGQEFKTRGRIVLWKE